MRWFAIQRIIGLLAVIFSVTSLPALGVSLYYGDGQEWLFVTVILINAGLGVFVWWPVRRNRDDLRIREGFLVVTLFWSVLSLLGSLPFWLGLHLDFTDSIFEAVSGFTTTGATAIVGLDELPRSILYHRQQLQWLGGIGVIVLAVAILPMLGLGGMQLYRAESSGVAKDEKMTPRIVETARALSMIYLSLTAACAGAYWWAGMAPFDAIGHAYSTVATAGFSTHDASIGHFDSAAIELIACFFMLLGGVNFAIHFAVWRRRDPTAYFRDPETLAYLYIVLVVVLLVALPLYTLNVYTVGPEALRAALFQTVSVITGTGYGTATFAEWPLYVPFLLAIVAFIGGCAGSTTGGMKVVRFMLLAKQGSRQIYSLVHPRSVSVVKLGRRAVPEEVVQSVWGFFVLYIMTAVLVTGGMMAAGLDLESAFGATAASITLLGPGLGEVATTFATTGPAVKWLAIFAMLVGRLEVFTLLVLFTFAFWRD